VCVCGVVAKENADFYDFHHWLMIVMPSANGLIW